MKISIHQPNFMPWGGFFEKINRSDLFVLLDHVQYSKGSYTNRVLMSNSGNPFLFTLPTIKNSDFTINKVEIFNWSKSKKKLIGTIKQSYPKCYLFLKDILENDYQFISDLNTDLIIAIAKELGITTKIIKSSDYDYKGKKSDLVLHIVEKNMGSVYISGGKVNKYLEIESFKEKNIEVSFIDFSQSWDNVTILNYIEKNDKKEYTRFSSTY